MSDKATDELIGYVSLHDAFGRLERELNAAGVVDPAERRRAKRMLVEQLKVQRAATEAVAR